MAAKLPRTTAFAALGRAFAAGARGGPSVGHRLAALPRMIKASLTGEYDGGKRLAMMAAGLLYVASPLDLVPEALLLLVGLADDAIVITWVAGALLSETQRFLEWEQQRSVVIDGHSPRPSDRRRRR